MKEVTVLQGQTIFDLAIQEFGHIEGVKNIMANNPTVENINHNFSPGDKVTISGEVIDEDVYNYYRKKGVKPVSGVPKSGGFSSGFSNGFKQ